MPAVSRALTGFYDEVLAIEWMDRVVEGMGCGREWYGSSSGIGTVGLELGSGRGRRGVWLVLLLLSDDGRHGMPMNGADTECCSVHADGWRMPWLVHRRSDAAHSRPANSHHPLSVVLKELVDDDGKSSRLME